MTTLITISCFKKIDGGDVVGSLYQSISFLQTTYCFPPESEFYTITNLISPDLSYVEYHIEYHDLDSYNKWYELFGEIVEELVTEFRKEFEALNITYQRYLDPQCPIKPDDALLLDQHVCKFTLVNGVIEYKNEE